MNRTSEMTEISAGRLWHFAPGEGAAADAHSTHFDDADWLPIRLPETAHRAVLRAGLIPDPFYDRNETACAWMEEREWWYRLPFFLPEPSLATSERFRLIFHGLDTFATIWLDGEPLGTHQNMFRPAEFVLPASLQPGDHLLAIAFDTPLRRIEGKTLSRWGRNPERTAMRKAQYGFGWDWGPRLPTVGVWLPVELRRERIATIPGVHFATVDIAPDRSCAAVKVRLEIDRFAGEIELAARIELSAPDGTSILQELAITGDNATAYLSVPAPRLWWTHDLGDADRYELRVTLLAGGRPIAEDVRKVGIRTIELDQSPDPGEPGTRFFRFVLNGVPIFAKGANWIPADSFIDGIGAERYDQLLSAARDANMTMIRVWGGGIYEREEFYEACDRLGLLVWQDFAFACAMYPEDDPAFVAEVEREAAYQVRRLRSRPSLALWCGNNENQWLHERANWNAAEPPVYGALYYDRILPVAVREWDGHVPYWPGSPFGGDDHNDRRQGNVHNWDVWHGNLPRRFGEEPRFDRSPEGVTFLRYAEDDGRFISEFGMHAAPVVETLRRVIPADQLFHHSPAMDWHNKDNPKDKGDNLMLGVTGLPATLEEYIDFSMIAQAEGLKFGIEHFRRRKPHCSGTLVWQLNDCWPVLSWSVLDYYGNGKAGLYYLRRVYSPVLASFKRCANGAIELWITNDAPHSVRESARVRLASFDGAVEWESTVEIGVPAHGNACVRRWEPYEVAAGADRYLSVRSVEDRFPSNRHFFVPIKDLRRSIPTVEVSADQIDDGEVRVTVAAPKNAYAFFVNLAVPHAGATYSDNFFDLEPGEHRTISVRHAANVLSPADVTVRSR